MEIYGSESNGLENLFHHIFKNEGSIYREEESVFNSKSKKMFDHRDFSQVEYFTILPSNKPNHFAPYFYISNSRDSRNITYEVIKDGALISFKTITIENTTSFFDLLEFNGDYKIIFTISDNSGYEQKKKFTINKNYYDNILPNNGSITLKEESITPKIKIIHLLTNPKDEREQTSVDSISKLGEYQDIEYTQQINTPYEDSPPSLSCSRPEDRKSVV